MSICLFCSVLTFVLNPGKKIQSTLIITSEKLAVLNEGFYNCDLFRYVTYTFEFFHYNLMSEMFYV